MAAPPRNTASGALQPFHKLRQRGLALFGYRADPFAGIEVTLHQEVTDGLINIAAEE